MTDQHVIFKIINAIHPKTSEILFEIGPGFGALTLPLLQEIKKLYAIELDRDVIPPLKALAAPVGELILYEGDVLKFKFEDMFPAVQKIRCIGNLPYNISSPLIFHLLEQKQWISDMHFMLQKEMVNRIIAKPGSKDYGRLSVMVQYHCKVEKLFVISPNAFNPAPKVDSAIIRLIPYETIPFKAKDILKFSDLVRAAFNQRRKMISNSLKEFISSEQLTSIGIDPHIRAENLTVSDFVKMTYVE